jgi:hypothetical protein
MKRTALLLGCFLLGALVSTQATTVQLYVDSAPNKYGSPNWGPWWNQAKADAVGGTFVNLGNGTYPNSLRIDPYDEIVYSTGDLGKRLHWIYWLPGETTSGLAGRFEVKWVIDWAGDAWTYDWSAYDWIADGPSVGWVQPSSWEDYSGGVIGTFGFAWWSTDNDAPPFSTNANPYDETNQADIDALRCLVFNNQTYALGMVRYRDSVNDPWQYKTLKVTVPEGGMTLGLLGIALSGLGLVRRR